MTDQYADIARGFRYTEIELSVEPAQQAEKLACCGIDPELYRGFVDPTHFASEAILAAVKSGLSINGNVHWSERFVMRDRIPLDDPLTMRGEITMFEPHPRGWQMRSTFNYSRPDGSVPLTTERTSLRLAPKKAIAGGHKSAPRDLTGFETIAEFSFQPELVARYSAAGNNRIHFDPAVAREFGFRAPIAGGLMGVRHIMAALCSGDGPPSNFDLFVQFRRPMFWDEDMRVMAMRRDDGSFEQIHLVNAGGRIAVEGSFTTLD
jgi:hypothetical protein